MKALRMKKLIAFSVIAVLVLSACTPSTSSIPPGVPPSPDCEWEFGQMVDGGSTIQQAGFTASPTFRPAIRSTPRVYKPSKTRKYKSTPYVKTWHWDCD